MRIAAIDQGTTSTRALIVEPDGTATICHSVRHRQIYPHVGWVEHDPLELLANMRACVAAIGNANAIGIANQGESCLAWDARTKAALSPVIVWQDNRTTSRTKELKALGAEALTLERAGLLLDPYFSATKLAWILKNIPAARSAHASGRLRLGTTDAFFLDNLTGVCATDIATASRTSLMDLKTGRWDIDLCRLFDVPIETLPEIRSTTGDFGSIGKTPVTASIVDQQAALFGHGCRKPGDAKITFGTGAFALAVTGQNIVLATDVGLLPTVAWRMDDDQTTYAVDGGVYDAGAAVEWAGQLGLITDHAQLDAFDAPPAITRDLAFVPALSGLASPHWDRSASALWIGMSADTTRADLTQALLEGIAFRTAEVIAAMDKRVCINDGLSVDGGLTRSTYFVQFLADITGREIIAPEFSELTALGCAELAASGLSYTLPRSTDNARKYHPRNCDRHAWQARFGGAVERSRKWR